MTDNDYKDMVISHDKHIDTLAVSIGSLAESVSGTNNKLDEVISVISTQNVLVEKFTNLEANLKESFTRVHGKIAHIEDNQNVAGCAVLNVEAEKIKVVNKRMEAVEVEVRKILPPTVIKTIGMLLILQAIAFGTYVTNSLHHLDTAKATTQTKLATYEKSLNKAELYQVRNREKIDNYYMLKRDQVTYPAGVPR